MVAREAGLFVDRYVFLVPKSSAPSAHYRQVLGGTGLALGEPVVPRRVWVPSMKLSELLQTAYRKVVEWFFCPVPAFRIVEPFDEVKDSSSLFAGRHYLFDIVFFRMLDVVGLS